MPGSNAGTGRPINFQCSQCRRKNQPWLPLGTQPERHGYWNEVTLTGRERNAKLGNAGIRNSEKEREYKCNHCGHVGWSRHVDLERRWVRKDAGDQ